MTTLSVWKFTDPKAAAEVRDKVLALQKQELIKVHDAVVVSWEEGAKKPKTHETVNTTAAGAAGGAFWGMLFGLIFFVPLFGAALGAAMGALSGSMADFGINDEFIDSVRKEVTPGTSALFIMSSDAVRDRVKEALGGQTGELIATNLSAEGEEALREAFEA